MTVIFYELIDCYFIHSINITDYYYSKGQREIRVNLNNTFDEMTDVLEESVVTPTNTLRYNSLQAPPTPPLHSTMYIPHSLDVCDDKEEGEISRILEIEELQDIQKDSEKEEGEVSQEMYPRKRPIEEIESERSGWLQLELTTDKSNDYCDAARLKLRPREIVTYTDTNYSKVSTTQDKIDALIGTEEEEEYVPSTNESEESDDDIEDNLLSKTLLQSSNTLTCSGDSTQPFNKSDLRSSDSTQTTVDPYPNMKHTGSGIFKLDGDRRGIFVDPAANHCSLCGLKPNKYH